MKEIIIRIRNPHCTGEILGNKNNLNCLDLIIDGKPIHQVKRFTIDIDTENMFDDGYKDFSYTLEQYLNVHEKYYDNSDTIKEPDDWYAVKNR